jgi:tRNA G18 (ribose-2'-O)-methylase SpoU
MLRTADGLGIDEVYLTGYTPYPQSDSDSRLPHLSTKIDKQITKTSLGAEKSVCWEHYDKLPTALDKLRKKGYIIAALEQTADSTLLADFQPPEKIVLIVGSEVNGLDEKTLNLANECLEIPMQGKKESFNVAVAAAIALYHLKNVRVNR